MGRGRRGDGVSSSKELLDNTPKRLWYWVTYLWIRWFG